MQKDRNHSKTHPAKRVIKFAMYYVLFLGMPTIFALESWSSGGSIKDGIILGALCEGLFFAFVAWWFVPLVVLAIESLFD